MLLTISKPDDGKPCVFCVRGERHYELNAHSAVGHFIYFAIEKLSISFDVIHSNIQTFSTVAPHLQYFLAATLSELP